MKKFLLCIFALCACLAASAAEMPKLTEAQCEGTAMPYPAPAALVETPDSLTPVMINHVGRHGARYLSSSKAVGALRSALHEADSLGTITPDGKRLARLTDYVMRVCHGRWGALDSLGMAEQRGIAARMFKSFPTLFKQREVKAYSSRIPRCVNSMYTFLYQLTRLDNKIDITATSGPAENAMLRPFSVDEAFMQWTDEASWKGPLDSFMDTEAPLTPLIKVLGKQFPLQPDEARSLVMDYYKVIAGMSAMALPVKPADWFTPEEYRQLWACNNLRQYLQRSASTLSMLPAEIASPLLLDIIDTTEKAVEADKGLRKGDTPAYPGAILRFGHAETIIPLLALMRMPGAYYLTNYFDTVEQHWHNFHVSPMAGNLQLVLFKNRKGEYYVRFDLNEKPVSLDTANPDRIYIPWEAARDRLLRCIPLYLR